MNAAVFEDVPMAELPQAWRDKLGSVLTGAEAYIRRIRVPRCVLRERAARAQDGESRLSAVRRASTEHAHGTRA